jgi:hypothetical protein
MKGIVKIRECYENRKIKMDRDWVVPEDVGKFEWGRKFTTVKKQVRLATLVIF